MSAAFKSQKEMYWHGKKSLGTCCKTNMYRSYNNIITFLMLIIDYKPLDSIVVWFDGTIIVHYNYYPILITTLFLFCLFGVPA